MYGKGLAYRPAQKQKRRGFPRRFRSSVVLFRSLQQAEHALLRLVGQRQRRDRDRLAGRQRLAVGRFLVGVGQRQVGRTRLQHVDQGLVEVLADLHHRQVGTKSGRFSAKRGAGGTQLGQRGVRRVVVQEVRARGQRS